MKFFGRKRTDHRSDDPIERQALSILTARHLREFIDLATVELLTIPKGGSIWPWKYAKQVEEALNRVDQQMIQRHIIEWMQINERLEELGDFENITPEDFI